MIFGLGFLLPLVSLLFRADEGEAAFRQADRRCRQYPLPRMLYRL